MENDYYYTKYLKYKAKYLNLIKQTGGEPTCRKLETKFEANGRNIGVCCTTTAESQCGYILSPNPNQDANKYAELEQNLKRKFKKIN